MLKHGCNRGEAPELHFWRDAAGHEVDLPVERAGGLRALEIKSGRTVAADWLDGLERFARLSGAAEGMLIYGGDQTQQRSSAAGRPFTAGATFPPPRGASWTCPAPRARPECPDHR